MLRGTTIFKCDNCKKKFKGLDIEYNCTSLSNPQRCPYCGSFHTIPSGSEIFFVLHTKLSGKEWMNPGNMK